MIDQMNCPLPTVSDEIQLQHGAGGRLTRDLIHTVCLKHLGNEFLAQDHDSVELPPQLGATVFANDSFVVRPLFFPGGDIGKLAVCGIVNDLAMSGASAKYLSLGLIIEEGFLKEKLEQVIRSVAETAGLAGVKVVCGDTKVVERGKGDGIYLSLSGIGEKVTKQVILPTEISAGDVILVTGDLGRHGATILSQREGLEVCSSLKSDCGLLARPILGALTSGIKIHCMRDCTRGGLATALNELSLKSGLTFTLQREALIITPEVEAVAEIYGLDPLYLANEGCAVLLVSQEDAENAVAQLKEYPETRNVRQVGWVSKERYPQVLLRNEYGTDRIVDYLAGDLLPRIC